MKLVSHKNYVAGWLDSSIHKLIQILADAANVKYALITSLDSNPETASLRNKSPELKPLAHISEPLGKGLLIPTKFLRDDHMWERIFFGFDEVFFFPDSDIAPKPNSSSLVGPARLDPSTLEMLVGWMSKSSCSLALGDGEGLNFIVKAHGLAKLLLGHSIQQSVPS